MPPTRASETPRGESRLALLVAAALLVTPGPAPVAADVIFDGTIGPRGEGTSADPLETGLYIIPEESGEIRGSNLFHSFSVFDVARNETARLTGSGLERVILRVTAGKFTVDGTLESVIPDADVIVLSPAGIDVGGEATFDHQGSLFMRTAQTLAFSDGSFRSSAEGHPWSSSDPDVPCCGQAPIPVGIFFDGTIGPRGEGTSADPLETGLYIIPEEDGELQGKNLFHSFSRFIVARDETARLTGSDPDLKRVILRVTAGKFVLDGTLESEILDADVIVLSPAGIDVGGEATFDLQGSLSMSTAQTLEFSDGSFRSSAEGDPWSSSDPAVPCCRQAPTGFGFDVNTDPDVGNFDLDLDSAQVLRVPRGEVLRMVVRKFTGNGGQIKSDGGTIYVAAVGAGAVEVPFDVDADTAWLSGVGSDGLVDLNNVLIDANPESLPGSSGGRVLGGRVLLRGGRLKLAGSQGQVRASGEPTSPAIDLMASQSIAIDTKLERALENVAVLTDVPGIRIVAPEVTVGETKRGAILARRAGVEIRASESLRLANNSRILVFAGSANETRPIVLHVGTLSMEGQNTGIDARDRAPDAPYAIVIDASGAVQLRDGASIITQTGVSPDAGAISISAAALHLEGDGTAIQTQGRAPGTPESLLVVATGEVSLRDGAVITSLPSGSQDAGDIRVEAGALSLEDGGQIQSPTESAQATGNIDVVVDGPIRISGVKVLGNDKAHAGLRTQAGPSAGDVTIEADSLEITDGGLITSSSMESGSAGEIRIRVRGHMLIGGSDEGKPVEIASRGFGTADAGSVDLQVGSLEIRDDGGIFVGSFGTQPGGGISIDAADQVTIVDGNVNAESYFSEAGGDISITAGNLIQLVRSKIETRVRNEEGRGGNIFIGGDVGPRLAVINNSRIKADANQGPGGNITIRAGNLLMSAEPGQIDASSDAGLDGSVEIAAPEVQAEGQLAPLPVAYLDVTAILREHCASQRGAGASSFVIEGRPGIAPEPGGYLPSFPSAPAGEDTAPPGTSQAPNLRAASVVTQLTRFDCGRDWPLSAAR